MRNIKKQASQGRNIISPNRDLTVPELMQLKEIFDSHSKMIDGLYYSITEAFYAGVAIGHRQAKNK